MAKAPSLWKDGNKGTQRTRKLSTGKALWSWRNGNRRFMDIHGDRPKVLRPNVELDDLGRAKVACLLELVSAGLQDTVPAQQRATLQGVRQLLHPDGMEECSTSTISPPCCSSNIWSAFSTRTSTPHQT